MATVVESSTTSPPANARNRYAIASVIGSLLVLAGIVLVGYILPSYWSQTVTPQLTGSIGSFLDVGLRLFVQAVLALGLIYILPRFSGDSPPLGLRGGIFLTISWLFVSFFVVRAVAIWTQEMGFTGQLITGSVCTGMLFLAFRMLTSNTGYGWATTIEEQGFLHTFSYKKTQGLKMRRYTLLGFLIMGWSGVYSLSINEPFGRGDWLLAMPYGLNKLTFLRDVQFTLPILLAGLILWLSWRAVNMPTFGDFLIATEAEMNKVSWTSRKRLMQDTIVVLVTLFLMTFFLFVVDWFWGTALSWKPIGVLPSQKESREQIDPLQGRKLDW
jgi:preprotein translocase SecE subunit